MNYLGAATEVVKYDVLVNTREHPPKFMIYLELPLKVAHSFNHYQKG